MESREEERRADRQSVGREVRRLRERRSMTLVTLASLARVTPGYLSRLERGQRGARPEVLERIAGALRTTPGDPDDERAGTTAIHGHAPPQERDHAAGRLRHTLGIDLSNIRASVCRITWLSATAEVSFPIGVRGDDALLDLIDTADITGIDAPFGWPDAFVDALAAHRSAKPWPGRGQSRIFYQENLRMRTTDRKVWEHLQNVLPADEDVGLFPLSVSTDRIGVTALRMANLQDQLAQRWGRPINRVIDRVIEVYPAAALRRWQLDRGRYKPHAHTGERASIVDQLVRATGGRLLLDTAAREECQRHSHALDALVAALVAAAAYLDRTSRPKDSSEEDTARREGWIHLPDLEVDELFQLACPELHRRKPRQISNDPVADHPGAQPLTVPP